jgi:hypothetical protein
MSTTEKDIMMLLVQLHLGLIKYESVRSKI